MTRAAMTPPATAPPPPDDEGVLAPPVAIGTGALVEARPGVKEDITRMVGDTSAAENELEGSEGVQTNGEGSVQAWGNIVIDIHCMMSASVPSESNPLSLYFKPSIHFTSLAKVGQLKLGHYGMYGSHVSHSKLAAAHQYNTQYRELSVHVSKYSSHIRSHQYMAQYFFIGLTISSYMQVDTSHTIDTHTHTHPLPFPTTSKYCDLL